MRRWLLALAILALGVSGAAAQSGDARELQRIEKQLRDRQREEARLKNEAKSREKEAAALQRRMIETAGALQKAERRIGEINAEIADLERRQKAAADRLSHERATLGDALGALQSIERAKPPALLVAPDDAAAAARAAMLLADVAPQIEARASVMRATLDELARVAEALRAERAAAEKTNAEIDQRRSVLAELFEKKREESRVALRLAAAAQSETAALAVRATDLRDVIDRLARLARAVTPRLKPRRTAEPGLPPAPDLRPRARPDPVAPARPFASAKGALKPPVVGKVIARFGSPRADGKTFEGVRYEVKNGAIVTAPFEGAVAVARAWEPVGNLIVLDVGGGYHIVFLGVGAFLVEEGQSVKAGEPLAAMAGDGALLDLEIRKSGAPVNPLLWLQREAGATDAGGNSAS
jgi:septal ring factor EnvC (AmiA/AmiB activator)